MSGRVKRRSIRKTSSRRGQQSWVLKHKQKFARRHSNPGMLFTCHLKGGMMDSKYSEVLSKHREEAKKGRRGPVSSSLECQAKDFGLDSMDRYPMGRQYS